VPSRFDFDGVTCKKDIAREVFGHHMSNELVLLTIAGTT